MRHLTRQLNIIPRLIMLENIQISPPSAAAIKGYEEMDRLLIIARTKANASVRHLHMINVHSSRTVKLYQLLIRLATLLIQMKDRDRRVKLKTVTNMKKLTGIRWWLTLDLGKLIHQKSKSKKYYQNCKKECLKLRATNLE